MPLDRFKRKQPQLRQRMRRKCLLFFVVLPAAAACDSHTPAHAQAPINGSAISSVRATAAGRVPAPLRHPWHRHLPNWVLQHRLFLFNCHWTAQNLAQSGGRRGASACPSGRSRRRRLRLSTAGSSPGCCSRAASLPQNCGPRDKRSAPLVERDAGDSRAPLEGASLS